MKPKQSIPYETDLSANVEDMRRPQVPWPELNRRYVAVIETMAADSGVSVTRFCKEIGIPPKNVSLRKGNHRGMRGIPFPDQNALDTIGVRKAVFTDAKVDNVRDYLPENIVKIAKLHRRTRGQIDEITVMKNDINDIKSTLKLICDALRIDPGLRVSAGDRNTKKT